MTHCRCAPPRSRGLAEQGLTQDSEQQRGGGHGDCDHGHGHEGSLEGVAYLGRRRQAPRTRNVCTFEWRGVPKACQQPRLRKRPRRAKAGRVGHGEQLRRGPAGMAH
eukprot:586232-Alexandrium_andersonii.AAC.2